MGLHLRRRLPGARHGAALVLPFADTEAMNLHLAEIARTVAPGAHAVLVLDGAGWHGVLHDKSKIENNSTAAD